MYLRSEKNTTNVLQILKLPFKLQKFVNVQFINGAVIVDKCICDVLHTLVKQARDCTDFD